jgi:3-hydroxyacyl-CoA dehydrogenase
MKQERIIVQNIVCEFMMQNSNFKSYVAENKISVKQSATVIKVTDDTAVQTIKDTIDIVVKAIAEEREFKKQLAREKRRAKRQEQE